MLAIDAEAPRCPFPHETAHPDDATAARWHDAARRAATSTARERARFSHVDEERAAAMAAQAVEGRAQSRRLQEIDEHFVHQVGQKLGYGHPLSERTGTLDFTWTPEAEERLRQVPEFCRELTRWRVEWTAHKRNLGTTITPEIMETKYAMWGEVSAAIERRHEPDIPWTESARRRLERVPDFVRGQVIDAVEGNAARLGREEVDDSVLDVTIGRWSRSGDFHEGRFGFR